MTQDQAERAAHLAKAAMAEAGHPMDAWACEAPAGTWSHDHGGWDAKFQSSAPPSLVYKASCLVSEVVGYPMPCFACWESDPDIAYRCVEGDCSA